MQKSHHVQFAKGMNHIMCKHIVYNSHLVQATSQIIAHTNHIMYVWQNIWTASFTITACTIHMLDSHHVRTTPCTITSCTRSMIDLHHARTTSFSIHTEHSLHPMISVFGCPSELQNVSGLQMSTAGAARNPSLNNMRSP